MPNWVAHRVQVIGPDAQEFIRKHIVKRAGDEKVCLDFNTIIPMPKALRNTTAGSVEDLGMAAHGVPNSLYRTLAQQIAFEVELINKHKGAKLKPTQRSLAAWVKKNDPIAWARGAEAKELAKKYGHADWYSWSCDNWGTKWNACHYKAVPASDQPIRKRGRIVADPSVGVHHFTFDTAWSHPEPIFRKLAEMYPRTRFDVACIDEGFCFAGLGSYNGTPEFVQFSEKEPFTQTKKVYQMVHGYAFTEED